MNKHGRDLLGFLKEVGFTELRSGKLGTTYRHPEYPRNVTITPSVSDSECSHMIENISRTLGITTAKSQRKRKATQARSRTQSREAREKAARDKQREEYLARVEEKEREAAEKAARLEKEQRDRDYIRITEYIEKKERDRRRLMYDMSAVPLHARHEHTRHRA